MSAEKYAIAKEADEAASAILVLLNAERKRSKTVQWMPQGTGCRFEVIDVASGKYDAIVRVWGDGSVIFGRVPSSEEQQADVERFSDHLARAAGGLSSGQEAK